jgi:hypothetical protein
MIIGAGEKSEDRRRRKGTGWAYEAEKIAMWKEPDM